MDKYRISTGGDPRAFTEFGLLRDEISKLTHPARPDVDWQKVEQLSLALFRHNGVELQTLVHRRQNTECGTGGTCRMRGTPGGLTDAPLECNMATANSCPR